MSKSSDSDHDQDSRTATIGVKSSSSKLQSYQSSLTSSPTPSVSSDAPSAHLSALGNSLHREHPLPYSPQLSAFARTAFSRPVSPDSIASPPLVGDTMTKGLGTNRLAAGFRGYKAAPVDEPSSVGTQDIPVTLPASPGHSVGDAIEITDDEESESGGMLINIDQPLLDHQLHDEMALDAEMSESEDEGQIKSATSTPSEHQPRLDHSTSSPDTTEQTLPIVKLRDLSSAEQELQFKYALYHLERSRIDMTTPAVCLSCMKSDHVQENCPERVCLHCAAIGQHSSRLCPSIARCSRCRQPGHNVKSCSSDVKITTVPCDLCSNLGHVEDACPRRFFPASTRPPSVPINLWISCCLCASKSHLVGDCPDADQAATARWSLKHFDSSKIVNLTLEKSTRQLEKQAASRGLRPEGLSIRGRAAINHMGRYTRLDSDKDDSEPEFIRPRVNPTHQQGRGGFQFRPSQQRGAPHDRSRDDGPPSGGRDRRRAPDWYSTDSFGHRRSQSPPTSRDSYSEFSERRGPERRRSRSPRGFDGYRPGRRRSPSPRRQDGSRNLLSAQSKNVSTIRNNPPGRGISVELPVRRGSNNIQEHQLPAKSPVADSSGSAAGHPQSSQPSAVSSGNDTTKSKRKRPRRKKATD